MQVGEVAQIPASFAGVHKLPAEHAAKVHVVAAASPVPVRPPRSSAPVVAGAGLDGPLGTRASDRVGHPGAGDGKHERGLSAACGGH